MMISRKSQMGSWQARGAVALLVAFVAMLVVGVSAPLASAASDDPNELAKALGTQRYYVTQDVLTNRGKQFPNMEQEIRDAVNKLKGKQDTRIAILSNKTIPSQYNGNAQRYTEFLFGYLSNPKPDAVVLVNAETNQVFISASKLSDAEVQQIYSDTRSTFNTRGLGAGAAEVAQKAADKVSANETGGLLTTIAIIAVVVLVIAGAVTFLLINTKKRWKEKVTGLEQLANQVSDQVVRVSDEVNFLPEATKAQTDADFGTATQNFSEANTRLRELQGASPVTLLLKGPDFQRKLDLTGAQFEQTRQALTRVEQRVRSLPGL